MQPAMRQPNLTPRAIIQLAPKGRAHSSCFLKTTLVSILTLGPILITLAIKAITGLPLFDLIRDPSHVTGAPPYIGFLSQIGGFFWISTATICLFSSHILKASGAAIRHSKLLNLAGLFTLLLAIDDVFMIHDHLFPSVFGISERPILLAYAVFLGWLLFRYREIILHSNWRLLAFSLLIYSGSIAVDKWNHPSEIRILVEDGFKLAGTVLLMSYFSELSISAITALSAGRFKTRDLLPPHESNVPNPHLALHQPSQ